MSCVLQFIGEQFLSKEHEVIVKLVMLFSFISHFQPPKVHKSLKQRVPMMHDAYTNGQCKQSSVMDGKIYAAPISVNKCPQTQGALSQKVS